MPISRYYKLGFFPTPLHRLSRLSERYNDYNIFIKRDDQSGLAMGGNKVRKLEYLVQDAIDKGCDSLITYGAAQSNHCRQTAAAAAQTGLKCHLLLHGVQPDEHNGNLLLDKILGANIYWTEENVEELTLEGLFEMVKQSGQKPYLIPLGGSNEIGCLGYVRSILEFKQQLFDEMLDMDYIVFASCSGGTHAGMLVGKALYNLSTEIVGISIAKDEVGRSPLSLQIIDIANKASSLLNLEKRFNSNDVILEGGYDSAGYGVITKQELDALNLLAQQEGILLDPVYTARAFAGFVDLMDKKRFPKGSNIVFWHTGGTPAIFHYASQLIKLHYLR